MEEDLKFLENRINNARDRIYKASSLLFNILIDGGPKHFELEEEEFAKDRTFEEIKTFYNLIIVYLEMKGLTNYLLLFKTKYEDLILSREKSIKIVSVYLGNGDYYEDLDILLEWNLFLSPFKFYHETETREYKKLINLLKCTNEILKTVKLRPKKEDDINKTMRLFAGFYFDGVIAFSEGYFRHQFKSYKPDIIIKEIGTSVEYKLIRNNKEVGIKMDELISDSKRYSDNFYNKNCVAVFCLSTTVTTTQKRIKEDWDNMNFPKNWELIIISDVEIF